MRITIPGVPGVYYDTDAKSTALTTVLSMVGRRAPKPNGYALQVLPHLWSFDVDLRDVPADHPFQYLHPEGAHSIEELTREHVAAPGVGRDLEVVVQYVWAINRETERGLDAVLDRDADEEGLLIEIDDGELAVEREESVGRRIEIDDGVDSSAGGDGIAESDGDEGDRPGGAEE